MFLILGWWWDFRRAEGQSKERGSLSLPVLAVPSLLVPCWLLILRSFTWASFGACLIPQWADAVHTISRKRKIFSWNFSNLHLLALKSEQCQGQSERRSGLHSQGRGGETFEEQGAFESSQPSPKMSPWWRGMLHPSELDAGLRPQLCPIARCRAQLHSSFHHWYYWWSISQETIAWNLQCK